MSHVEGDLDLADIQILVLSFLYTAPTMRPRQVYGIQIPEVMPLETFRKMSRLIRFDDKQTRISSNPVCVEQMC